MRFIFHKTMNLKLSRILFDWGKCLQECDFLHYHYQIKSIPGKGGETKLDSVEPCVQFWEPSRETNTSEAPGRPSWRCVSQLWTNLERVSQSEKRRGFLSRRERNPCVQAKAKVEKKGKIPAEGRAKAGQRQGKQSAWLSSLAQSAGLSPAPPKRPFFSSALKKNSPPLNLRRYKQRIGPRKIPRPR